MVNSIELEYMSVSNVENIDVTVVDDAYEALDDAVAVVDAL